MFSSFCLVAMLPHYGEMKLYITYIIWKCTKIYDSYKVRETSKQIVDKDMNDLHLQPSAAMHGSQ